jgi:serine protease Do
LTNNHLVEKADEILVVLPDMQEYDAKVVGTDPKTDVAVLKIDADGLPTISVGSSKDLRLGETVIAIGYPFGVGQTVTMGIVSALGRSQLRLVEQEYFIQTDAAINPGNSGGALINARGELIGVNTAILSRTGGNQGIGFAIPIDLANSVMESIIEYGRVVRGWLGVVIQDMTPQMAEVFELDEAKGVIVSDVNEDSPALTGGIERGDVMISYDGEELDSAAELQQLVAATKPGDKAVIEVLRDGDVKKLSVKIGERPGAEGGESEGADAETSEVLSGLKIDDITDRYRRQLDLPANIDGALITDVEEGSAAADAGLRPGDVIIEVNRRRIDDADEFYQRVERSDGDKVLLLVYRDGSHFYVLLRK